MYFVVCSPDPSSLTCDQWVLLKQWRPRRLPHSRRYNCLCVLYAYGYGFKWSCFHRQSAVPKNIYMLSANHTLTSLFRQESFDACMACGEKADGNKSKAKRAVFRRLICLLKVAHFPPEVKPLYTKHISPAVSAFTSEMT